MVNAVDAVSHGGGSGAAAGGVGVVVGGGLVFSVGWVSSLLSVLAAEDGGGGLGVAGADGAARLGVEFLVLFGGAMTPQTNF